MPAINSSRLNSVRLRVVVRWAVALVFIVAGAFKIARPGDFYADLLAYEVALPDLMLRLVAVTLPWLELGCGGCLLANRWSQSVTFSAALMSLIFVMMLGQAVARGLDLRCGCFGVAGGWLDRPDVALARAGGLLAAAVWVWLRSVELRPDAKSAA